MFILRAKNPFSLNPRQGISSQLLFLAKDEYFPRRLPGSPIVRLVKLSEPHRPQPVSLGPFCKPPPFLLVSHLKFSSLTCLLPHHSPAQREVLHRAHHPHQGESTSFSHGCSSTKYVWNISRESSSPCCYKFILILSCSQF